MKKNMKSGKMVKKANALKGFLNSASKPKMQQGGEDRTYTYQDDTKPPASFRERVVRGDYDIERKSFLNPQVTKLAERATAKNIMTSGEAPRRERVRVASEYTGIPRKYVRAESPTAVGEVLRSIAPKKGSRGGSGQSPFWGASRCIGGGCLDPKAGNTYKKGGSFPDMNKDGQITKADILMGRGVIGKKKAQKGMNKPSSQPMGLIYDPKEVSKLPSFEDYMKKKAARGPVKQVSIDTSIQKPNATPMGMLYDSTRKSNLPEYKPKGQKGMNVMKEAKKNATPSIPNSYYKMGGMKEQNPLASMIKKKPMKKAGMKPKMQMGGAFFPQNPLTASKYQNDTLMGQSFKKGGMVKKKKK